MAVVIFLLGTVFHSGFCILRNYLATRRIGVPIHFILLDHVSSLCLVVDQSVILLVRFVPFGLENNSLTR